MKKTTATLMILLLGLLVLSVGCRSNTPTSGQLLQEDYHQMTDSELLDYYQQLLERIEEPGGGAGGFGFGIGLGVGGGSGGVSLGASTGPQPTPSTEALQQRRNQVRLELARRGLEPTITD